MRVTFKVGCRRGQAQKPVGGDQQAESEDGAADPISELAQAHGEARFASRYVGANGSKQETDQHHGDGSKPRPPSKSDRNGELTDHQRSKISWSQLQHHGMPPLPPSKVSPHHQRCNDQEVPGSPPIDASTAEKQPPKNQAETDDSKKAGRRRREHPLAQTTRRAERRALETGNRNDGQRQSDAAE